MGSGDVNEMDFALIHLPVPAEDKSHSSKDFAAEYPDEHGYLGERRAGCYSCTIEKNNNFMNLFKCHQLT